MLTIETSSRSGGGICLAELDGPAARVVAVQTWPNTNAQQARELVATAATLCRGVGWSPDQLGVVAVSAGPGSYTGLRLAVTMTKTLALAVGARVVALPSALVTAAHAPSEVERVAVVLDAKRGELWAVVMERDPNGDWQAAGDAVLAAPAALAAQLPRPIWVVGEGLRTAPEFAADELASPDTTLTVGPPALWTPQVAQATRLAAAWVHAGRFCDAPQALTPIYLRRPEAEDVWDARYGPGGSPFEPVPPAQA